MGDKVAEEVVAVAAAVDEELGDDDDNSLLDDNVECAKGEVSTTAAMEFGFNISFAKNINTPTYLSNVLIAVSCRNYVH